MCFIYCSLNSPNDIACRKNSRLPISSCDKDSQDLLMSIYVVVTTMLNDIFKSFTPIKEDRLQVFKDQLVPYLVKLSSTARNTRSLIHASTFRITKSRTDSGLANKVGEELGSASDCQVDQSSCDHCDTWNCRSRQQISSANSLENSHPCLNNIGYNAIDEIFFSESRTR
jgi:hypothetical protein